MLDTQLLLLISEWIGMVALVWLIKLSPNLNFRPIGFVYARREGIISLSLYFSMLLVAVGLMTNRVQVDMQPPADVPEDIWVRMIVGVIAMLAFGLSVLIRRQPLRSVGWNQARMGTAARIALAAGLLTIFLRAKVDTLINGITPTEFSLMLVWLVIALAEETIFRGFIQLRLNYWMGSPYGWLATALLYVLWSLPFYINSPQLLVYKLLMTVCQSLVLGWMSQKTGHVLPIFVYRFLSEWLVYTV
jgi:membrane protease YdiL (CAAX protease family)